MRIRIEMDGLFGVASTMMVWPGFAAHAVDLDRPFISETDYRSFLGYHVGVEPGIAPEQLVPRVIRAHIANKKYGLKGKLVAIKPEYAERRFAEKESGI